MKNSSLLAQEIRQINALPLNFDAYPMEIALLALSITRIKNRSPCALYLSYFTRKK